MQKGRESAGGGSDPYGGRPHPKGAERKRSGWAEPHTEPRRSPRGGADGDGGVRSDARALAQTVDLSLLVSREACFVRGMQGQRGQHATPKQLDWLREIVRRQRIYLSIDREERRAIEDALAPEDPQRN